MDESAADAAVARIKELTPRRSKWRWGSDQVQVSPRVQDEHLYVRIGRADGPPELRRITKHETIPYCPGLQLIFVSLRSRPLSMAFSACKMDDQKNAYDLILTGTWSIQNSQLFVGSRMLDVVAPGKSLSNEMAQSLMIQLVTEEIKREVHDYGIEQLIDQNAHPARFWEKKLAGEFEAQGISFHIREKQWTSAEAAAAEAETASRRAFQRIEEAKSREREAELREATAKSEYERRKREIENASELNEREREHELQLLEKRHLVELLKADTDIENARRVGETAAMEHELTLARLRNDFAAVKSFKSEEKKADECHQVLIKELESLKSAVAKLAELPDNLLAKIAGRDREESHKTIERLISPEFGFSTSILLGLGFRLERQYLIQALRQKGAADESVRICMKDIKSRDINNEIINALPINSSLQLEFSSDNSGYVTILNIGTSGTVYLHVPNPFISSVEAEAQAGCCYSVPGPEMLPWDRIGDYVEVGPPGWEHIVVIVSEKPLIEKRDLSGASQDKPFLVIPNRDLVRLFTKLENQGFQNWSAGVLSFLVE